MSYVGIVAAERRAQHVRPAYCDGNVVVAYELAVDHYIGALRLGEVLLYLIGDVVVNYFHCAVQER